MITAIVKVFYGSDEGMERGWYWESGPAGNGPHGSKEAAIEDARDYFDAPLFEDVEIKVEEVRWP